MGSSLLKIDLHIIFHTKMDSINIPRDVVNSMHAYIGGVVKQLGSIPFMVGGTSDHVHIAATLPKSMTVPGFVKEIKRSSSLWVKSLDVRYKRFCWQEGYAAFSVSASVLPKVVSYIENQEEHHKRMTYREEVEAFLRQYGVSYEAKYVFEE